MDLLKNTQNMKMAESSRSVSPIKKKVKRSQLTRTITTKTIFESEWKKGFFFITSVPDDAIATKRYSLNWSYYVIFL